MLKFNLLSFQYCLDFVSTLRRTGVFNNFNVTKFHSNNNYILNIFVFLSKLYFWPLLFTQKYLKQIYINWHEILYDYLQNIMNGIDYTHDNRLIICCYFAVNYELLSFFGDFPILLLYIIYYYY